MNKEKEKMKVLREGIATAVVFAEKDIKMGGFGKVGINAIKDSLIKSGLFRSDGEVFVWLMEMVKSGYIIRRVNILAKKINYRYNHNTESIMPRSQF